MLDRVISLFSIITNLLHFGMVIVGLDYGYSGQMALDEIAGGLRTVPRQLPKMMARLCRARTNWSGHATGACLSQISFKRTQALGSVGDEKKSSSGRFYQHLRQSVLASRPFGVQRFEAPMWLNSYSDRTDAPH